jgi:hypothetical protein
MKRCPKCNRNFPDDNQKFCTIDGGLLVAAEKPFDPNATIQGTTVDLSPAQPKPPSAPPPDFGQTIATPSTAPTVVLPKQTGPTGTPTSANLHQQQPQPQPPQQQQQQPSKPLPPQRASATVALPPRPAQQAPVAAAPPKKKSKLPLIIGILVLLLIFGAVAAAAAFFLVIKPRLDRNAEPPVVVRETRPENTNSENTNPPANTNTGETKPAETEFVAPPDTVKFTNSAANLDGKLAEHYFDFSFYYPKDWEPDPKAGVAGASNFAKVERRLPPDFTQENFAVGWYTSKGTYEEDKTTFPQLVEVLGGSLAKNIPEYHKLSEGPTKINSLDGYEFRFEGLSKTPEKGDIHIWGRVVFLPSGVAGDQNGATLVMLTTSLAPEVSGVDDIGTKGQMPVILESFRFGKPKS